MKVGLMLGGGGSKGAYQIGILKAFEEYNFIPEISTIAGTSIGALNGLFLLGSETCDAIKDAWLYGLNNNPITNRKKKRKKRENKGLFSMEIIREMALLHVDVDKVRNSETKLYVTSTRMKDPKLSSQVFKWKWEKHTSLINTSDYPIERAISSSTIPIVFGYNKVGESYYIDGGLVDNDPLDPLIEAGCDLIFLVPLHKRLNVKKYKKTNITFVNLTPKEVFKEGFLMSHLIALLFNKEVFERRMEYGYYVGKEMIKQLVSLGILKYHNGQVSKTESKSQFRYIDTPVYVNANVKLMILKDKEKLTSKKGDE